MLEARTDAISLRIIDLPNVDETIMAVNC